MVKGTLNELSQLKKSGFGQPPPRHGLNLLYWFAKEYIDFLDDGEMVPRSNPKNGDFGFKKFENRIEDEDDDRILPNQDLPYYEVGNLNARGADKLPHYVREKNNHNIPSSNKDRIIVRLDKHGRVNRVYVIEHSDQKHFDSSKTYRVSQGLLKSIRNITRESFLSNVTQQSDLSAGYHIRQQSVRSPPPENNSWCAIL